MKKVTFTAYGIMHTRYVFAGTDLEIQNFIKEAICSWAIIHSIENLSEVKWLRIFSSRITKTKRKINEHYLNYRFTREIRFLEGYSNL